ncbi:Phage terminase, small subunit [Blastopirellula retiformator]|uniref:Phage terminase, small subunit n=2 Tax=Blastopirellula retiformator TaxID=2527970 RepID=A0A5C5UUT1_9BACT|nr:Phage terminase, small subunit [Blastopirellula retiformator]
MKGRKPKPTVLKIREGNPGKRAINKAEPNAPDDVPSCPDFLDEVAQEEWHRIARILSDMGLLSTADRAALAAYCTVYSRWVHAEEQVRKFGTIVKSPDKGFPMKSPYLTVADQAMETMRKFLVEFGLTPSSRSRIRVDRKTAADDQFDLFVGAG